LPRSACSVSSPSTPRTQAFRSVESTALGDRGIHLET